jgi:hypothetical protein
MSKEDPWHAYCLELSCQLTDYYQLFLKIIPTSLKTHQKRSNADFTRKRILTLPRVVAFVLYITAIGNKKGVDTLLGLFFKNVKRSQCWTEIQTPHRSAVSKARKKVDWTVFLETFYTARQIAYDVWPDLPEYAWHGMSVFAVDGSKYNLPASEQLRRTYDPNSGLQNPGKGHYPQCLLNTAYDVFRRIPVARTVVGIHGSEQQEALAMLDKIPPNGVLMFDRGYPNFGLIKELTESYKGYFLMRCKVHKTFPVLYGFMDRNEAEAELWIDPSRNYLYTLPKEKRNQQTPIKCRAIRLEGRDGTLSVLLTNLLDRQEFPAQEVIDLYFRRWEVEDHYRNEKVVMEVEHFHATTQNGVLQELYAACIMTIITRTLMALSRELTDSKAVEPQFTHAINTLAMETAILVPDQPEKSVDIFKELIEEIARVKYYRPKIKRPSQPRIIKKPISKWLRVKRKNRAKKKKAT